MDSELIAIDADRKDVDAKMLKGDAKMLKINNVLHI